MRRRVYLSGAVEKHDNPESWRGWVEDEFSKIEFINPCDLDLDPAEDGYKIFHTCLRWVQLSDFMIVGYQSGVETWGTPMEVFWAWIQGIPVLTWSVEDIEDMPSFLVTVSDHIHCDVGELIERGWDLKRI